MIDLAWHPVGAFSLVSGALLTALGVFLYATGSQRERNVSLAAYLVLSGIAPATHNGLRLLAVDPADAYAFFITGQAVGILALGAYLRFLATLDSPLVSWIRRPVASWLLGVPFVGLAASMLARPEAWVAGVSPFPGIGGWAAMSTPLRDGYLFGITVFLIVSATPAIHAWHRAPQGILRRQAAVTAIVFVARAASLAGLIAWTLARWRLGDPITQGQALTNFLWPAFTNIAFVVGLTYGILKFQLFDIDLKIKWSIRRGTLVSVFLAAFFAASAIAQLFLEQYGIVAGGAAVGLLLFAIRPIERAADRLADRAMPRVQDTAEYRTVRKREVYRAAVESALVDGSLSEKDRGVLATLAQQLELGAKDAHDIEREARAARAGV